MKTFLVGGAVRDALMGGGSNDRDYVVVGATREEMLKKGFSEVGADFPVFLDPKTGDQYALARKERKTGKGYLGFECEYDPSVTLKDDLFRRDLTINSIAIDMETQEIIDPFGGQEDIQNKILRHVSPAFSEDPLRVIRLARFASRFLDFSIAPETDHLAFDLVATGELNELADERFWGEMTKVFEQSEEPRKFFDVLHNWYVFDKVEFFRSLFGIQRGDFSYADVCRAWLHEDDRLPMFVALQALKGGALGTTTPIRLQKLKDNIDYIRDMRGTIPPYDNAIMNLLLKNRAFGESLTFYDLTKAMRVAERHGEKFKVSVSALIEVRNRASKITAEPFMHLKGPEIGKAMNEARMRIISEYLKGI